MCFYMVPIDKAIMEELGCSVCIIPLTSQGKSKDLESNSHREQTVQT